MTESIIQQEHYGTVARWFDRRQLGSIHSASDEVEQHIFLIAEDLPDYYRTPQVGDEIVCRIERDEKKRLIAKHIEPLPPQRRRHYSCDLAKLGFESQRRFRDLRTV